MSVKRNMRWVVTLAVVAVCVATVAAGAAVTRNADEGTSQLPPLRATAITPTGPLVQLTDLKPGDQRTTNFTMTNPNDSEIDARIYGSLTSGSQSLYDNLIAELATAGSGVVWRGQLGQLSGDSAAVAPIQSNASEPMTLTISVPPELGNNFQSLTSRFNLGFALEHPGWMSRDQTAPKSRITSIRPVRTRLKRTLSMRKLRKKRVKIYGRSLDAESGVARVEVSLLKVINRGKREKFCRSWNPARSRYQYVGKRKGSCQRRIWFNAYGADRFRLTLTPRMTKRGRYVLRIRGIDRVGNVESSFSPRKKNVFRYKIRP